MLKIKKKNGSKIKAEIAPDNTNDDTKDFLDEWLKELQDEHPDLFDAISKPLIVKSALDEALSGGGVYKMDTDNVIKNLELEETIGDIVKHRDGNGKQTKKNKSRKGNGRGKHKGLKKPHTDI